MNNLNENIINNDDLAHTQNNVELPQQAIENYAIEMENISKSFLNGKVIANDGIHLKVKENEIHAIIGENGAGKSTLMSILFGIYAQDTGTIKVHGKNVYFSSAKDASAVGLGMVHQHFKLVSNYSVYQNIILGSENTVGKLGILSHKEAKNKINKLIKTYNFNLNINTKIYNLTVGQEQKTEILKLLYRDSDILIFDEPTAILSQDEIIQFLNMLRALKAEGKTIIIITHKLSEIKEVADRATVIRRGKYITDFDVADKTIDWMAEAMVGKRIDTIVNEENSIFGKPVLEVRNLKITKDYLSRSFNNLIKYPAIYKMDKLISKRSKLVIEGDVDKIDKCIKQTNKVYNGFIKKLENKIKSKNNPSKEKSVLFNFKREFQISGSDAQTINFSIHEGEIFAVAGVEGNGQSELAWILSGLQKTKNCEIKLLGEDITYATIKERNSLGMSHVPEDRHKYGLVLDQAIYLNTVINKIDERPFSRFGFINDLSIREFARSLIKKYDVRGTTRGTAPSRLLSGGNQQKLIVGREITNKHKLIIMVQPTRGLDLGAINYIHYQIMREKEKGNAVLLISYELDEILSLADTIAVMYNGKFKDIGDKRKMTKQYIGQLMAGKK